jgi:hypothetical protein
LPSAFEPREEVFHFGFQAAQVRGPDCDLPVAAKFLGHRNMRQLMLSLHQ